MSEPNLEDILIARIEQLMKQVDSLEGAILRVMRRVDALEMRWLE